jgi:hypothetical protein
VYFSSVQEKIWVFYGVHASTFIRKLWCLYVFRAPSNRPKRNYKVFMVTPDKDFAIGF